jgi:hypothetical protein
VEIHERLISLKDEGLRVTAVNDRNGRKRIGWFSAALGSVLATMTGCESVKTKKGYGRFIRPQTVQVVFKPQAYMVDPRYGPSPHPLPPPYPNFKYASSYIKSLEAYTPAELYEFGPDERLTEFESTDPNELIGRVKPSSLKTPRLKGTSSSVQGGSLRSTSSLHESSWIKDQR